MPPRAPGAAWTLLLPPGIDAPAWAGVNAKPIRLPRLPGNLRKLWWEQVAARNDLAPALARAWSRCVDGQVAVVRIAVGLDDPPPCLWPPAEQQEES